MKIFSIHIRFARFLPFLNFQLLSISLSSNEDEVWDKTLAIMCVRWVDGWHFLGSLGSTRLLTNSG